MVVGDQLHLEPEGTIEWFDKDGVILDKGMGEFNKHGNDSCSIYKEVLTI